MGLVLPSTASMGAAGPGHWKEFQAKGRNEWQLTRSSLGSLWKRLCLPDNHKWFQMILHGIGTGRSRQIPKALGVGQCPQCGLAAPCPTRNPGIPPSPLAQSLPKNPGGSSTASTSPAQGEEGSLTPTVGYWSHWFLTSCNFLINT